MVQSVPINYANLSLIDVMMHQIRKTSDGAASKFDTLLTDAPVTLTAEDLRYLTSRFKKSLLGRATPVIEDPGITTEVRGYIREAWGLAPNIVDISKRMTLELAARQPGSALEGLLFVATARVGEEETIVVAKVEHQEAMRLEPVKDAAGLQVFEVERIRDLVFGDVARIFKVAVFVRAASAQGVLSGDVVDEQNGNGIAAYFLGSFLGMKYREEPSVLTEQFMDRFTNAINASSLPSERRLDIQSALISEMTSNKRNLDPNEFIRDHVPSAFATEIRSLASEKGAPMIVFSKDISRIDSKLNRVRVNLSNDVHVVAPPDLIGPNGDVTVETSVDGQDVIRIKGRIESIRNSGSR